MREIKLQKTLVVVATVMLSIVCSNSVVADSVALSSTASAQTKAKSSSTTALTATEVHSRQAHKNMAAYANQAAQNQQNQQRQQHSTHQHQDQQHATAEQQQKRHHQQRGNYRYSNGNINVNSDDGVDVAGEHAMPGTTSPVTHSRGTTTFKKSKIRRSYNTLNAQRGDPTVASAAALTAGTFNDLTNLPTGSQHISDSYSLAASLPLSAITGRMVREQIPIYEEQQENDFGQAAAGGAFGASGAATATPTTGYAGENNHQSSGNSHFERHHNDGNTARANVALHTAIYNLRTAGTHTAFVPSLGTDVESTSGLGGGHYPHANYEASTPQEAHNFNDKISADGNFPHHYEHNSAYNELSATDLFHHHQEQQQQEKEQQKQHQEWQLQQHIQQFQQQQQEYLPSHISNSLHDDNAASTHQGFDAASDFLHSSHLSDASNAPPSVINYVPYPVVKKLHVPMHEPVQIPISHAVIMTVAKPVPIHIPVTQQVQVPVEKELKIPVERLVPIPVEKHIPVPVEKRVPFPVVKYVPVKVPRPFPVKVPVFKTILHKIKSWW